SERAPGQRYVDESVDALHALPYHRPDGVACRRRQSTAGTHAVGTVAAHCLEAPVTQVEAKLEAMGLTLPAPPAPVANYVRAVQVGNLVFLSGHGPTRDGSFAFQGKVGAERTVEEGYQAAQLVMLNCLASLKEAIGDLDRVERIVKLLGMVN